MTTRFRIPLLLIVGAGLLVGCDVVELRSQFIFGLYAATRDLPAICPPPVIDREEVDLPGFGTLARFSSPSHVMYFVGLNNGGQIALNTAVPISFIGTCEAPVVVGEQAVALARPNVNPWVTDLNDSGLAVGYYYEPGRDGEPNAVAWRDGAFIPLSDPGGKPTEALAVNNRNVIVGIEREGHEWPELALTELVMWEPEGDTWTMTRLGVRDASPSDVNDQGHIVGVIQGQPPSLVDPPADVQPFLWREGELINLPTLGGPGSRVVAVSGINNAGWMVGTLDLPLAEGAGEDERPQVRGVLWKDGQIVELETLGGGGNSFRAVGDGGLIVGSSQTADGDWHFCVWEEGVPRDLSDLIPSALGVTLGYLHAINDDGVIVANTTDTDSTRNLVMLIPSKEK